MSYSLEEIYPVVFKGYIDLIKDAFDVKFYPQQVNVLDSNIEVPCIYISGVRMPNEGFCGGINNMEVVFSMGIATRKSNVQSVDASVELLGFYGKFLDEFDTQKHTFTLNDGTITLQGDIIDSSPRMIMQDDGAYGIKLLTFDYSYEVVL